MKIVLLEDLFGVLGGFWFYKFEVFCFYKFFLKVELCKDKILFFVVFVVFWDNVLFFVINVLFI